MKKISIMIPCYNEEDNVVPMANALTDIMKNLPKYEYEIVFRDNASEDRTLERLREIASNDQRIKVISNCRNYGNDDLKETLYRRLTGDIIIYIPCDFQEPPELIPEFVHWYEQGYEVVMGQKTGSKEGWLKYGLRQIYYKIISSLSDTRQEDNVSGIVLSSRRIMEMHWNNNLYEPFRFFVSDVGCDVKLVQYEQQERKAGKSKHTIWTYLSFSITSMISTTTVPLRMATILGFICSAMSFFVGLVYLVIKLVWWDRFSAGMAPILIGVFFMGSVQLLFIGILGEYIGNILKKVTPQNPPLVKELINFDNDEEDPYLVKPGKGESD